MQISVVHFTVYKYESAVQPAPHTFRMRPRNDGAQRLLKHRLEISPAPAGRTECLDQDGNVVVEAWFDSRVNALAVTSEFEVETLRENPFDFLLAGSEVAILPLAYEEPLNSLLGPYARTENGSGPVREFARCVSEDADWRTLPFLTALNRTLHQTFRHIIRDDGPPHPPEVTLRDRQGSCRDLAVLFCTACRSVGIPARFVSGYECEASKQERPEMHAWAEVYIAGGGWRGYDPSQGLAVSTSHVAVAAAADPSLAAPVSGSYFGAVNSEMEFRISMRVEQGG